MLLSPCASAKELASINDGLDTLRAQFSRDAGPHTDGYSIDYSYFSPVKDNNDTSKYPLVIIMAGAREGAYEGKELLANEFANWSSKEFQARFAFTGGAFILIARAPEEKLLCWDSSKLVKPLKAALDDFIEKHPNVDTDRIYAIGWCLGAKGAINITADYPGFVDAVIIMVPPFTISDSLAKKLSKIPVWLVGCKSDSYALYNLYIEPIWKTLKNTTSIPSQIRLTSFDTAVNGTIFLNHNVWLQFSHDMAYSGNEYSGMKTIDGNSQEVSTSIGCIRWLSLKGLHVPKISNTENDKCPCICHSSNIVFKLVWRIKVILSVVFLSNDIRRCKCGEGHFVGQ